MIGCRHRLVDDNYLARSLDAPPPKRGQISHARQSDERTNEQDSRPRTRPVCRGDTRARGTGRPRCCVLLRISVIVDAQISLIVDAVSA